jgi:hypothetical protein
MRNKARAVLVVVLGGVVAGCLRPPEKLGGADAAPQARAVEGMDADGATLRLSDYRGKVVLLHFWHAA